MNRALWLVAYDVSDDRRRRSLESALHAFGERVQYSVFECRFTLAEARFHLARLATDIDPETDSIRAYPLCAWCAATVVHAGLDVSHDFNKQVV